MFFSISENTKNNFHPSYTGKAPKENSNVAKNSARNRSELLIHCPVLTRYSGHRSDCNSVSKLGKGSTLNRKGYYIALIPNATYKKTCKQQQPVSPKPKKTTPNKPTLPHHLQKNPKAPTLIQKSQTQITALTPY